MTTPDATTMTELIEDCAQIPYSVTHAQHPLPGPRAAAIWQVDESLKKQFDGLNDYGS